MTDTHQHRAGVNDSNPLLRLLAWLSRPVEDAMTRRLAVAQTMPIPPSLSLTPDAGLRPLEVARPGNPAAYQCCACCSAYTAAPCPVIHLSPCDRPEHDQGWSA